MLHALTVAYRKCLGRLGRASNTQDDFSEAKDCGSYVSTLSPFVIIIHLVVISIFNSLPQIHLD
jgi:hypothetical protein